MIVKWLNFLPGKIIEIAMVWTDVEQWFSTGSVLPGKIIEKGTFYFLIAKFFVT